MQGFIGIKAALAGAARRRLLRLLLVLTGGSPLIVFLAGVIGWFGPTSGSRAGRLRQERIERDLPDFLDILAVTVRAGLGYRPRWGAWRSRSAARSGEEMLTALRQMDLGASRREAFLALRDAQRSESLATFVAAQLQAEELGVPLSEALNDIAEDMRRGPRRTRRAGRRGPRRGSR